MTEHTCTTLTPGCYRCGLNVDEIADRQKDACQELFGMREARDLLADRCKELEDEIRAHQTMLDAWAEKVR